MYSKPFVVTKESTVDQHNVMSLFGLSSKPVDPDSIGLEIEVEGNSFPKSTGEYSNNAHLIPKQWKYTHDGSLRGQDNAEYVLKDPLPYHKVDKAVDDLWGMFAAHGSVLADSNRTSVHVHLNAQHFRLNRLCSFAALYFCVEEVLTAWCGDHRVGNLFCLRAKDAPAIVSKLRQLLVKGNSRVIAGDDGLHYAGFNTQALAKFGSIEIRTLRGAREPEVIKTWVGVLKHIYDLSEKYADEPRDICEGFSGAPHMDFVRRILGPYADEIVTNCGMTNDQVRRSVHEGVRIAQNLCYCRDWSQFDKTEANPDPFGRSWSEIEYIEDQEQALTNVATSTVFSTPYSIGSLMATLSVPVTSSDEDFNLDEEPDYEEDYEEL